jgi:hypothetical protein
MAYSLGTRCLAEFIGMIIVIYTGERAAAQDNDAAASLHTRTRRELGGVPSELGCSKQSKATLSHAAASMLPIQHQVYCLCRLFATWVAGCLGKTFGQQVAKVARQLLQCLSADRHGHSLHVL